MLMLFSEAWKLAQTVGYRISSQTFSLESQTILMGEGGGESGGEVWPVRLGLPGDGCVCVFFLQRLGPNGPARSRLEFRLELGKGRA